jgi:cell division control protein 6
MRDHLSELAMLGIISVTERNEGRRGGTYREYALDLDPALVLSALEETVESVGIHDSVMDFVDIDPREVANADENATLTEY